MTASVPAFLLLASIVAQAVLPKRGLLIVLGGAALSGAWATLAATATPSELLAAIPWDVFVILVSLGTISQLFAHSRLFDRLAVRVAELGGADPARITPLFAAVMFFVSGLVNNLTALLLVLPVLLMLVRLVGTTQRHLRWTIGTLIVACNLGGASTPVGDFPAVLLLGAGAMSFADYLVRAFPAALAGLVVLFLLVVLVVRPARDVEQSALGQRLTVAVVRGLYRNVRVDIGTTGRTAVVLAAMVCGWMTLPSFGITPDLVAWLGASIALTSVVVTSRLGARERRARSGRTRDLARAALVKGLDVEATLFLFALFFMVGVVRTTGFFPSLADWLLALPAGPDAKLMVFLCAAGLATGLFSAGPSMAALLEVAQELTRSLPAPAVYVGLAMSVCAGSSLLLTAATAGPLAQAMVERAKLEGRDGEPLAFGFAQFLPVGLASFAVIEVVALVTGLVLAR